jgi:hypothetical protein
MPIEIERPVDVPIKEPDHAVNEGALQEVPYSTEEMFSKASVLAMHFINAPRKEALLRGMRIYLDILSMVMAYDEKADNEFFQQNKSLCFVAEGTDTSSWTRDDYLFHRKELTSNLTNYFLRYEDGMASLYAAVANLLTLSNVNGTGKYSSFGFSCRWSFVRSANNRLSNFAQVKGHADYFSHWAKFAAGTTQFGAVTVSIPWFKVAIWGNMGQHTFAPSDWFACFDVDGDAPKAINWDSADGKQLKKLAKNLRDTMLNYGWDASHLKGSKTVHYSYIASKIAEEVENDKTANTFNIMLSDPHLENGAFLELQNTGAGRNSGFMMNNDTAALYSGFTACAAPGGKPSFRDDNIISRAWDDLNFMYAYMQEFFPEMSQTNNELRKFFIETAQLCDDGLTIDEFKDKVNVGYAFDMADLQRKRLIYKQKGATNTATIVQWEPIYADHDESSRDEENFVRNFQRIRFDSDSDSDMLAQAREHVRLTPTLFDNLAEDQKHPYVFNTVASGSVVIDDALVSKPLKAPLGRYSSLMDRVVKMNSRNPESNVLYTIGQDPKDVLDNFIKPANNHSFGINLDDQDVWIPTLPAIDSTDPYSCGFCVIISEESKVLNEYERIYRNPENYIQGPKDVEDHIPVGEAVPQNGAHTTANPNIQNLPTIDLGTGNRNLLQHVINDDYLSRVKHALIFLGDGIWDHPFLRSSKYQSGTYDEQMVVNEPEDLSDPAGFNAVMQRVNGDLSHLVDPTVIDKDQFDTLSFEAMLLVLAGFACDQIDATSDHDKIAGGKVASGYVSMMNFVFNEWSTIMLGGFGAHVFTYSPMYGDVAPAVYDIPAHLPLNAYSGQTADEVLSEQTDVCTEYLGAPAAAMTSSGDGIAPESLGKSNMLAGVSSAAQYLLWFFDRMVCAMYSNNKFKVVTGKDSMELSGFSGPAKKAFTFMNRGRVFHMGGKQPKTIAQLASEVKFDLDTVELDKTEINMGSLVLPPRIRKNSVKVGSSLFSDRHRSIKRVDSYMVGAAKPGSQAESRPSTPAQERKEDNYGDDSPKSKPTAGKKGNWNGKRKAFQKSNMRDDATANLPPSDLKEADSISEESKVNGVK